MADPLALATTYPERLPCYPGPGADSLHWDSSTNISCTTATPTMINFLNLTEFQSYKQAYCLNPPSDSCAFGYCGNPDIASPGFRLASYLCTICLSIVILFSNEEAVEAALYAQLLSTYSYILAAIIAIAKHNITRLHTVFVLQMTGSPLSFYLIVTMLKSGMTKHKEGLAAWRRKLTNRGLVLLLAPLWIAIVIFVALPAHVWQFQQAACDSIVLDGHVAALFSAPVVFFFLDRGWTIFNLSLFGVLISTWAVCIYLQRGAAQKLRVEEGRNWFTAMWRSVVDVYPCIQLITVVIYPCLYWIVALEVSAVISQEEFQPSYGQLLAIFVAVPALLQTLPLVPRMGPWFINLTWVRFLTCRRHKSRVDLPPTVSGGYQALGNSKRSVADVKSDIEATYPTTEHLELQVLEPNLSGLRGYP